ncbi:spermidine synthase [Comamonas sp. Z3]|uniref:spermine/spermidine synthase domain-containing protein n=1 Tax=Comamonas sp. Z3 TaxID=2601247 RepID=UPI0011E7B619|nr:spermidine synthase [Comamonas sp. Z3]TYK72489.1 spermidine synthase [Comamonas sp. Z3]
MIRKTRGGAKSAQDKNVGSVQELPEVSVSDDGDIRYLHLGTPWVQGSMRIRDPFDIDLEYVQRMMGWLLFAEPVEVPRMHAMQLGLGAAAITKFCHKKLRMKTTAVELNPQVLAVCRSWFKLPPDSSTLQVVLADAAQEIKKPEWQGTVDALAVDLYDHEAAAPVLDSAEFYADCRNLLTEDGIMTVNLFGRSSSFDKSLDQMAQAFGEDALWAFRPTREGNTVVLAQRRPRVLQGTELDLACDQVQARWDLNTTRWAKVFVPARDAEAGRKTARSKVVRIDRGAAE